MASTADLLPDDVRRLPGLYRRWELTEVLEAHRNYQIEDAGTHADGTPLLAIYVSDPVPAPSKILPTRSPSPSIPLAERLWRSHGPSDFTYPRDHAR